ncbi:DUF397 domain-containing protein [Streptomyces sp. BE147]|uniref:DUF397 domain-containing protein n=1 Tax=Streptomyces sp. BE147 TaxID=3002524 RepID=UPI002E764ED2|nr:DUF397 domain-containing protein [Streptomyces sp. BE147]MEE1736077.1 DUF397 domain-containing protein [Streptomyces sp. BE147]
MSADLHWLMSGYSGNRGGSCTEAAACPRTVRVRDSEDPAVPAPSRSPGARSSLLGHAAGSAV